MEELLVRSGRWNRSGKMKIKYKKNVGEETHCYLVCGAEKAVLIDTGLAIFRYIFDNMN